MLDLIIFVNFVKYFVLFVVKEKIKPLSTLRPYIKMLDLIILVNFVKYFVLFVLKEKINH